MKLIWILGALACVVGILGVLLYVSRSRGILCEISNASEFTVTEVVITAAGNQNRVGRLNPGESHRVRLRPLNHAGAIELAFILPDGSDKREVIYGYVESKGFRGEIHAEIGLDGSVRIVSNTIRVGIL